MSLRACKPAKRGWVTRGTKKPSLQIGSIPTGACCAGIAGLCLARWQVRRPAAAATRTSHKSVPAKRGLRCVGPLLAAVRPNFAAKVAPQRPKTPFELQRRNRLVPQSLPQAWCPKKENRVNRTGSLQRDESVVTVLRGRAGVFPARNDTERGTPARRGAVAQNQQTASFKPNNERQQRAAS